MLAGCFVVFRRHFCYNRLMKLFVIGDTHGRLAKVRDIWPKLKDIDLIVHTGDHFSDAEKLEAEFHVPVVAVGGNCDSSGPARQIIETEAGRILLTHGHREGVKYDLNTLRYACLEADCIAAIFGHTHQSLIPEEGGIRFGMAALKNVGEAFVDRLVEERRAGGEFRWAVRPPP